MPNRRESSRQRHRLRDRLLHPHRVHNPVNTTRTCNKLRSVNWLTGWAT
jgi:hypothetical protein